MVADEYNMGVTNKKLYKFILRLQDLHKNHKSFKKNGWELTKASKDKIEKMGKIILEEKLVSKCEDKQFARNLLMSNEVPSKYWENA